MAYRNIAWDIVFLALYFFSIVHAYSTAMVSISMGLCIAYILFEIIKKRNITPLIVDKRMYGALGVFFLTLFLDSILLKDIASLKWAQTMFEFFFVPFFIVSYLAKNRRAISVCVAVICFTVFIMSAITFYEYFVLHMHRVYVSYSHPNWYALALVFLVPTLLLYTLHMYRKKEDKRIIAAYVITITMSFLSLLFTGSRGGMMGMFGGLIAMLIIHSIVLHKGKKMVAVAIMFALAISATVYFTNIGTYGSDRTSGDMTRIHMWQSSINMWKDHKLLGVGLANWRETYYESYILPNEHWNGAYHPHNMYLYFLSATGALGTVGFLVWTLGTIFILIRTLKTTNGNWLILAILWSFIGCYISGFVDSGLSSKWLGRLFFGMLGLGTGMIRIANEEMKSSKSEYI